MANTVTLKLLAESTNRVIYYLSLSSDGSTTTNYAIYSSSTVATALGITDAKNSFIRSVNCQVAAAATARVWLDWDATTKVLAVAVPAAKGELEVCYEETGLLPNLGGSGKTGDILFNATGLASGDKISMVIEVRPA